MSKKFQAALTIALLCVSSAAMAESALSQLAAQAGVEPAPLAAQMNAFKTSARVTPVAIPMRGKDVLNGCLATDHQAMAAVEWTLPQAVGEIQACLNKVYASDAQPRDYTVKVEAARLDVRVCPQAQEGFVSCEALKEVQGLRITVSGKVLTGDPVLVDLDYAVSSRGGKLLGYDAEVENKAELAR